MAFEEFMYKSGREFMLLEQIVNYLQANLNQFFGQNFYLHLQGGAKSESMIDEVQDLKREADVWHFINIERENAACIQIKSEDLSVNVLMCGKFEWAEFRVTASQVTLLDGPRKSSLPEFRACPMSPYEMLEAFDLIGGSLQESKRKIS